MHTSPLDLVRLLAVPFLAWAAWTDLRTRRIPNRVWRPVFLVAGASLAVELWGLLGRVGTVSARIELAAMAISVGVIGPLAYLFWAFGGFGGADAKAVLAMALFVPTYPSYHLFGYRLPLHPTGLDSFAFTFFVNTVVVGAVFPLVLVAANLARGHVSWLALFGRRVDSDSVAQRHGRLLETPSGTTLSGLDLDALRMYLTWRDATLAEVRDAPARFRDPDSLPAERAAPGDGRVATDGGERIDDDETGSATRDPDGTAGDGPPSGADFDDPWAAERFLAEIDGSAYGTDPETLRAGLDTLTARDRVWYSPGFPYVVPMLGGLLLGLTVGDLLTIALSLL
ncbi:prepilin peptidase [Haloarcula litorea]|uniref:prepilin peptidase n=1 Tax=Haloarcula litorea TaxID=3032579 RepID=UPI0023E7FEEE|nr:A24 family peptidase [Halomicroarcula sp. GDY20]